MKFLDKLVIAVLSIATIAGSCQLNAMEPRPQDVSMEQNARACSICCMDYDKKDKACLVTSCCDQELCFACADKIFNEGYQKQNICSFCRSPREYLMRQFMRKLVEVLTLMNKNLSQTIPFTVQKIILEYVRALIIKDEEDARALAAHKKPRSNMLLPQDPESLLHFSSYGLTNLPSIFLTSLNLGSNNQLIGLPESILPSFNLSLQHANNQRVEPEVARLEVDLVNIVELLESYQNSSNANMYDVD